MGLKKLNILFYGRLPLGFSGWGRKDYHIVEMFKILIGTVDYQFIFCVLGDRSF